jgi:hypothetical protein
MKKLNLLVILAGLTIASSSHAILISPGGTATDLANNIAGSGITVSNVTYTGAANASGTFTGAAGAIGIDSGVLLTTGSAALAEGPNSSTSAGVSNSVAGDAALTFLSGFSTFDATILSFDFEFDGGLGGDLFLNYVFGSEEYNEFVDSGVNDVFAFFLDGVNIALLPDGSPVSIDDVNLFSHSDLFNDNTLGAADIEYDGFTDVMQVSALGLAAGIHTMTFAIADGGDSVLDSGVFLQASSFADVITPTDVPEPSIIALFGLGLIGLGFASRRRQS